MKRITHQLILVLLLTVLTACECLAFEKGDQFTDTDWNLIFYNNCGFPEMDRGYETVKWVTEGKNKILRFELRHGDKGLCASDDRERHGAPYWERAEVKQEEMLEENKKYSLDFDVRFVKGFKGEREAFFQIHQGVSGCRVGPGMMFKTFSQGFLAIYTRNPDDPNGRKIRGLVGQVVMGQWTKFKLVFDTSDNSEVALYKDGKLQIEGQPFHIYDCGEPHFKFGIYRPGDDGFGGTKTSIVDFDKFILKIIN